MISLVKAVCIKKFYLLTANVFTVSADGGDVKTCELDEGGASIAAVASTRI